MSSLIVNHLEALHHKLYFAFTYIKDIHQWGLSEDWRSLYQNFLETGAFMDDCDGFAFTAAEALVASGHASAGEVFVFRCMTEEPSGTNFNHMVCGVNVGLNTYILDNRCQQLQLMSEMTEYSFYDFMAYDDKGSWFLVE